MITRVSSVLAMAAIAATTHAAHVDPSVHRTLREQGTVNLMVTMKESNIRPLNAIQEPEFTSRGAMIESLVNSLERHAQASHKFIDALLKQESASTTPLFTSATSFWISNQKYIEGASPELVNSLLSNPDILEIRPELVLPLPKIRVTNELASNDATAATEWGVTKILAPSAWAEGINGTGVVVGTIDTGVRGTHSALKDNYVGAYGWYDPETKNDAPYDKQGHGSHTMGTIAGSNGIGVAPGAKWMTCKGCRQFGCSESDLLACAQFMTCPTDSKGLNKDCSKAPRIVSNSWGGGQGDTFYKAAVDTWQKAGIIPIFANGNNGPVCSSANSPGDYSNVIAVGATDSTDTIADYSSKGPSVTGLLKPEVSAPGSEVRSAWYTSDTAFRSISGTSMATPHVSGVVALLLSYNPKLTYSQVRDALIAGADQTNLIGDGKTCGNITQTQFPNNAFGHGRVNALVTLTKTD